MANNNHRPIPYPRPEPQWLTERMTGRTATERNEDMMHANDKYDDDNLSWYQNGPESPTFFKGEESDHRPHSHTNDTPRRDTEVGLFTDMMRSDTKISWLLNWEKVENELFERGNEGQRSDICQGCGENRPSSNKAASLGIDIMGTSLCKKCANQGYLARF